jgi:hypothetical protein
LVKVILSCFGIRRLITAFRKGKHRTISNIHSNITPYLHLSFLSGLFSWSLPRVIVQTFLMSSRCAACPHSRPP